MSRDFGFDDAAALLDYLQKLGISDCYLSPILKARPGSRHGYDVTDHTQINPDLGGADGLRRLSAELHKRKMGLLLDVVPNHMCVTHSSNVMWWDVLENGPSSERADTFDIDWRPPKRELDGKVLLPVLGEQYGRSLEDMQIRVAYERGAFIAWLADLPLPLFPPSWCLFLEPALDEIKKVLEESSDELLEFESIMTALRHMPPQTELDPVRIRERQREREAVRKRLMALTGRSAAVRHAVEKSVLDINGRRGEPRSFDRLEHLLADQAYRLSYWRVAADEINYRRFFDINDLAAIRVEDPEVFQMVHDRIIALVAEGTVTGLRVDHPDGLFDPSQYFEHLQKRCREASGKDGPFFIVAEKIVTGDEELRPWAIEGTTGYGFLNFVNGLFVDLQHERQFNTGYRRVTGATKGWHDLTVESKRLILQVSLSSELNVLARRLDRISEQHRWSRDFTLHNLRDALREVVVCFPVYRTYLRDGRADSEDVRHVRTAVRAAAEQNPAISRSVFEFIECVLLAEHPEGLTQEQIAERHLFVMRLQQFTGPVMAKGLEDTAFYLYNPLASLNEVGGDPARFGSAAGFFHRKNRVRLERWPHALLATSTHDTKRSEDCRARLNTLSEIPDDWFEAVRRWQAWNHNRKSMVQGRLVPSRNEEYLIYQTLLGTWPTTGLERVRDEYLGRLTDYLRKAVREAKVHSSWVSPNLEYEDAVGAFVKALVTAPPSDPFLEDFMNLGRRVEQAGQLNSLAQTLLKIASPGIPDVYQGSELWDLSLADPDNRRAVDYQVRRRMLAELDAREASEGAQATVRSLMVAPGDGGIKMWVTSRALRFRKSHPELLAQGSYAALRGKGTRSRHAIAFARAVRGVRMIALAGRFFLEMDAVPYLERAEEAWGETIVRLPADFAGVRYCDQFTGRVFSPCSSQSGGTLALAEVLASLPVALLAAVEPAHG